MSVLRWENPPKHGNCKLSKYQPVADALRARPGEWAVVVEGVSRGWAGGFAARIRNGRNPFAPGGSFEAKSVGPADGTSSSKVYARYVGGEAAS